jgi:N-methylhydantoinase B/oxoprolinase/acetone carboxylase alpha subunit
VGERVDPITVSVTSDIGGATHGAYNPGATEIWQEGLRITPLRLCEAGVVRDDVLRMIATNVRHPGDFQGDLAAMIGSARVGERRLLALLEEYGAPTVGPAVDAIRDGAERQTRACIATWADGVYRGEAVLDDDGHGIRDIHVRATVTKRGSDLTVAPYGILGGRDGLPHRYRLRSRGRRDRVLRTKEVGILVRPGDVFLVESGGGGGYGDPRQRTPEARAYDRENGFVTRRPARRNGRAGGRREGRRRAAGRPGR